MSIYFSSDFHLGHKVITKYRQQFETQEDHDEAIFKELSKLNKRDILYILGDFLFISDKYEEYLKRISEMPFRIKLLMGNHDNIDLYTQTIAKNIEVQLPLFSYKNYWLSHCPIIEQELRGRIGNIHGHLHYAELDNPRYFDVGLDKNDFKFVDFDNIKEIFKSRGF